MNSERYNQIQNTESSLINKDDKIKVVKNYNLKEKDDKNNHSISKDLKKKNLERIPRDFTNLNKLEEMIVLNEQNHHLKDFLFDIKLKTTEIKHLNPKNKENKENSKKMNGKRNN